MLKTNYFENNWIDLEINKRAFRLKSNKFKWIVIDLDCGQRPYEKDILEVVDKYMGIDLSEPLRNIKVVPDLNNPFLIVAGLALSLHYFAWVVMS